MTCKDPIISQVNNQIKCLQDILKKSNNHKSLMHANKLENDFNNLITAYKDAFSKTYSNISRSRQHILTTLEENNWALEIYKKRS